MAAAGFVHTNTAIAIALTSTALGTLIPILRDIGDLTGPLGRLIMANGAVGEFGPIIAIALLLGVHGAVSAMALLGVFALAALTAMAVSRLLHAGTLRQVIQRGDMGSSQSTIRLMVVLVIALVVVAAHLGFDVVLGAFAAGVIMRATFPHDGPIFEYKLDALAFGLLIPIFFVVSGMGLDVGAVLQNPMRLLVFFVLIALVRGVPVLALFWGKLDGTRPLQLALLSSTGLPIIVAVTAIGLQMGIIWPQNAAALVGAGLLSVLAFPLAAMLLGRRSAAVPAVVAPDTPG